MPSLLAACLPRLREQRTYPQNVSRFGASRGSLRLGVGV